MNDTRFAAEYKKSVDAVALPADYQEKILSRLREVSTSPKDSLKPEKEKGKIGGRVSYSFIASLAAVLVLAVGLTAVLSVVPVMPDSTVVSFSVASATNLGAVQGARIVFKDSGGELLTDSKGEVVTAVTDSKGEARATIPATQEYTAQITAQGYITLEDSADKGSYYVSPEMDESTYRAVLTWNEECDLDAHLSVTTAEGTEKLNYFNSDIEDEKGNVIAALDVDNETGDGPETITFNAYDDAVFRFSVASYSALKNGGEGRLSATGAQVTLYRGEICIGTYSIDTKSQGNAWCVFEVEDSELRLCDDTYSVSAITEIK